MACPTLTWVTFCPFSGLRDGMNTRVAGDQTLGPNWERRLSSPSSLYGSASTAGVPWSPPLSDSPSIETKTMDRSQDERVTQIAEATDPVRALTPCHTA